MPGVRVALWIVVAVAMYRRKGGSSLSPHEALETRRAGFPRPSSFPDAAR
jgi:hypothetical protein